MLLKSHELRYSYCASAFSYVETGIYLQKKSYMFTLIAFVLGAVLGLILNKKIDVLQLIGSVFVGLIKLAVVPLVLVAVVNSILNIRGKKNAKKLVAIVLTMFVVSTAISATIGVANSLIVKPDS